MIKLQLQFKSVDGGLFIPRLLFEMEIYEIKFDVTCTVHVLIFNISPNKCIQTNTVKYSSAVLFLHVSAIECHPQGVYYNKGTQVQYADAGIDTLTVWHFGAKTCRI